MLLKCMVGMTEWFHLSSPLQRGQTCPVTGHSAHCSPHLAYLHPGLGQVDFHGQLFPGEHVRVVSLCKDSLQRLQL